jgi:F-type H+-transporting ATPase subunit delta
MKIGKQARRDAKDLFEACKISGVVDDGRVRQVVQRVIAGKPRGYLAVLEHFQRLVKLDITRRTARIENAIETPPALMEQIRAQLTQRYGPGLNFTFWINPELIGGLRIQVGSDVFDGTVKARLAALEESL